MPRALHVMMALIANAICPAIASAADYSAICATRSGTDTGFINQYYYFGITFSAAASGTVTSYRFLGDKLPNDVIAFQTICAKVACNAQFLDKKSFVLVMPLKIGAMPISNDGYMASAGDKEHNNRLVGVGQCGLRAGALQALPPGFDKN